MPDPHPDCGCTPTLFPRKGGCHGIVSKAEEIVDSVAGRNVLVLSRGAGNVTHFFARSIYARVLAALRGVTVCVAT